MNVFLVEWAIPTFCLFSILYVLAIEVYPITLDLASSPNEFDVVCDRKCRNLILLVTANLPEEAHDVTFPLSVPD